MGSPTLSYLTIFRFRGSQDKLSSLGFLDISDIKPVLDCAINPDVCVQEAKSISVRSNFVVYILLYYSLLTNYKNKKWSSHRVVHTNAAITRSATRRSCLPSPQCASLCATYTYNLLRNILLLIKIFFEKFKNKLNGYVCIKSNKEFYKNKLIDQLS